MVSFCDVPIRRTFTALQEDCEPNAETDWSHLLSPERQPGWEQIEQQWRVVVLAPAGAGKTHEMRARAVQLRTEGHRAFFIRIEDIETSFERMDVGSIAECDAWLTSTEPAWFFLDSVDEARLVSPRSLENAIKAFARRILPGLARAHVILSSRPYAWHDARDRALVRTTLGGAGAAEADGNVKVYSMDGLRSDDWRTLATAWALPETEALITLIERRNLDFMARQPFEFKLLVDKWNSDRAIGSRLQLLESFIDKLLREDNNDTHARQLPLTLQKARQGAMMLAAAIVLGARTAINVPEGGAGDGIDARAVLGDSWTPNEITALLQTGLFGDILYGQVRFRKVDMREFLAARFLETQLQQGNNRRTIESWIFRERYGEHFIAPRLRPLLPWLILFDDNIRSRALAISPDVALEGGDPASLPFLERQRILRETVARIAADTDDRNATHNGAIASIARPDLADLATELIAEHGDNDDALFFLGRLAWLGEMASCAPALLPIALSSARGIYARIAAARAVMSCGTASQANELWDGLNRGAQPLPRRLMAEVIDQALPKLANVIRLAQTLAELESFERFNDKGFTSALEAFVGRLPLPAKIGDDEPIIALLGDLHDRLAIPPFIERRHCEVSKGNIWLMAPALALIQRLVSVQSPAALLPQALDILTNYPAVKIWQAQHRDFDTKPLYDAVSKWSQLNDRLFWHHVAHWRARSEEPLQEPWPLRIAGHFWRFTPDDLPRVLAWMRPDQSIDDRNLIAMLAADLCIAADRSPAMVEMVEQALSGDTPLLARLAQRLAPPRERDDDRAWQRERREWEQKQAAERADWIRAMQANPAQIRRPEGFEPGTLTGWQWGLHQEIQDEEGGSGRWAQPNWRALIDEFGLPVAEAFRDAAMQFWRHYRLPDPSDGMPCTTIFALTGLEIEAAEIADFPLNLSESEIIIALGYINRELNGFPTWLEKVFNARPREVTEQIAATIRREWAAATEAPARSTIGDVCYGAPFLYTSLVERLLEIIAEMPAASQEQLLDGLRVIQSGGATPEAVAALASKWAQTDLALGVKTLWYGAWVDAEPEIALPSAEAWLSSLSAADATETAIGLVVALADLRPSRGTCICFARFKQPQFLLPLYQLACRYIRLEDDTDRSDAGVYSRTARDDAQQARGSILQALASIPGKSTFLALRELSASADDPRHQSWMRRLAQQRARSDGDIEPISSEQLARLAANGLVPQTHQQLFEVAVNGLLDMRHWLQHGHDSLASNWQRAPNETEIRKLIARDLGQRINAQAVAAQEHEMAGAERPDIWVQVLGDVAPVPIELKLLDQGWTGPELCERLLNQLAGDYLRDKRIRNGVFLLVWQGRDKPNRNWMIEGTAVDLSGLHLALAQYWQQNADQFPSVDEIAVIFVDLTARQSAQPAETAP